MNKIRSDRTSLTTAALLPCLLFSVFNASAEDKTLDLPNVEVTSTEVGDNGYIELEKTASVGKLNVAVEDTPFSISIINKDFMQDSGSKTLQDALLYTSGAYSGAFGLDTRIDAAKIRGLDPSLYLDGLQQTFGSYNSVRTNIYAIENIEVLKGPSSVLYGQGQLGGIVNQVSKLPKADQQGEIWAQYGSFDRAQIAFDFTGPLTEGGELLYRVVALKRDSDTQVNFVEDNGYLISPSITWQASENTRVSMLFNRQVTNGQVSAQFLPMFGTLVPGSLGTVSSDTFVGEPGWDRYDREKSEVSIFFDHQFNDNWNFSVTTRYTDSSTETREHWISIPGVPDANGNVARTIYTADAETSIFNLDARLSGAFDLGITKHTIAIGIDRQDALWEQDNYLYGYAAGGSINLYDPQYGNLNTAALAFASDRPDNEIKQVGIYLADHIEIGPVVASLALRRDWAENSQLALSGSDTVSDESATTGRIGLMYRFENGFSPYISYAEAFTMNLGTDGTPAANTLKPTTGDQVEYGFKFLSPDRSLALTAAYFDITQDNRVTNGVTPGGVTQVGATVEGWEFQINKRWKHFETQFNYTDLDAKDGTSGQRLPYVSENIATWWNKLSLGNGWRIGAGIRYVGDNVGFGGTPVVPSQTFYDAMVGYTRGNWEFTVDGKNLSDEEYISWCRSYGTDCGFGERRNITANVRYHF